MAAVERRRTLVLEPIVEFFNGLFDHCGPPVHFAHSPSIQVHEQWVHVHRLAQKAARRDRPTGLGDATSITPRTPLSAPDAIPSRRL